MKYRYQIDESKGLINLKLRRRWYVFIGLYCLASMLGVAGLIGWAEQEERKLNETLNEDEN